MVPITVCFSAAGTQAFVLPRDWTLKAVAFTGSAGNVLVSTNPARLTTDVLAPAANATFYDVIALRTGGASVAGTLVPMSLDLKFKEGSSIYINASAALSLTLFFD